jgi:DNA helicase-2/ATP-dependent DNA helicase PcrA
MKHTSPIQDLLSHLNPEQRRAATHGDGPLLIVAGAGTGKTATLVHRVAWLIANGVDPGRILLLTFTRRASAEMIRRVDGILRSLGQEVASGEPEVASRESAAGDGGRDEGGSATPYESASGNSPSTFHSPLSTVHCPPSTVHTPSPAPHFPPSAPRATRLWGGTFHAIATRLLRRHGKAIGLPPQFSIHDRADAEDLMNVVRTDLALAKIDQRFPKKGTCVDIYSRCVNAREKLDQALLEHFPWCLDWGEELKRLFDGYVDRKEAAGILDYDDLLLYWHALLGDEKAGPAVRKQFDCVLVDEYQDTNALQSEIVYLLSPEGKGVTVVGDDAQSIYSFRAATVRNIFEFPKHYADATIITLEQNYRSTCPILEATNQVIAQARQRYRKNLWSMRSHGQRPAVVNCEDEDDQTRYVIEHILEHREAGVALRRQAVLFRASHHSMVLEAELTSRKIPFHKYGGLKFVETAHVKDLLAFLRLADNPLDMVSGSRLLPLLPGIGPAKARQLMDMLIEAGGNFAVWAQWKAPPVAAPLWPGLVDLLQRLATSTEHLPAQLNRVRKFYSPLLEANYDHVPPRLRDLEQLELVAGRYRDRRQMLVEMALDPPSSTQDLAGDPVLDDDYLVLSTIHSAKGLEWDSVYVIHASDGNIPSDMATKDADSVEEELRLFYVALTRAKNYLYVCCPLRYYHSYRPGVSDRYGMAQRTRFLPEKVVVECFDRQVTTAFERVDDDHLGEIHSHLTSRDVRSRTKGLWA